VEYQWNIFTMGIMMDICVCIYMNNPIPHISPPAKKHESHDVRLKRHAVRRRLLPSGLASPISPF
jgi:hypothetical protein